MTLLVPWLTVRPADVGDMRITCAASATPGATRATAAPSQAAMRRPEGPVAPREFDFMETPLS